VAQKIRIDISDANGDRVGKGPLWAVPTLKVTRAFDGAGNIAVTLPGTEERAVDLATNERRARAYVVDEGADPRYVGSGVLRTITTGSSGSGWSLSASGPDLFDELKRRSVLLRREYRETTLRDVLEDLLAIAGWTVTVDDAVADELITVRFDGESILKAVQQLAANYGLHFREGLAARTMEFGAFGVPTSLVATTARSADRGVYGSSDLLIITKITVKRDTAGLVNRLYPLGAGEGLAALTLEHSTRTTPYAPQYVTGPDGNPIWYLEDAASIAEFGLAEKVCTFKDITPIDNTAIGIQRAANAMHDAATAHLQRFARRLDTYRLTVTKVAQTVRPGDKIRLVYKGVVYDEQGRPTDFLSVNEMVWVMKVTETFGRGGNTMDLEVTTVDRQEEDVAKIVVGALEAIELRNLKVQPYPTTMAYVYRREVDADHSAVVPIEITDGALYLDRARLRVTTRPFRATASGTSAAEATVGSTEVADTVVGSTASGGGVATSTASGGGVTTAAGGDHRHLVAKFQPALSDFTLGTDYWRDYLASRSNGDQALTFRLGAGPDTSDVYTYDASGNHTHTVPAHTHSFTVPAHSHQIEIPAHSHQITIPAHNHVLAYGIVDDDDHPALIHVKVNGEDRTAALGGPWAADGEAADFNFEIANYLNAALGGLRQQHQVEFWCEEGQGEVEVTVELKLTVQSIYQV
jgi:hypothetical protein